MNDRKNDVGGPGTFWELQVSVDKSLTQKKHGFFVLTRNTKEIQ